jgi:hypothetical protein
MHPGKVSQRHQQPFDPRRGEAISQFPQRNSGQSNIGSESCDINFETLPDPCQLNQPRHYETLASQSAAARTSQANDNDARILFAADHQLEPAFTIYRRMKILQNLFRTRVKMDTMLHDITLLGYHLDYSIGVTSLIREIGLSMSVNQVSVNFYVHLYHSPS